MLIQATHNKQHVMIFEILMIKILLWNHYRTEWELADQFKGLHRGALVCIMQIEKRMVRNISTIEDRNS